MRKRIALPGLSCLLLALGLARADGEDAFVLLDGERRATIVGYSWFLPKAVEKCTGVKLPQVHEVHYRPAPGDRPIYTSTTKKAQELLADQIAKLDIEGYVFLVKPEFIAIYGHPRLTDTGDPRIYAEANFARRFMGVDQYFRDELGRVYPKQDKVTIPCGLYVEEPAFRSRHWSGYGGSAGQAWRLRASGGGGRFRFHHNLYRIIDPRQCASHPEYFPVIFDETTIAKKRRGMHWDLTSGQRYVPTERFSAYWQPCTSNHEVLDATVAAARRWFAENPGHDGFSLGVNDSGGFCHCPRCLADAPPGAEPHSDPANGWRFYRFYEQVAERVARTNPDARLGFLVYSDLNDWYPERLHRNLMPYITLSFADCWDESYKERIYGHIERWSGIASQFGIYEWYHGKGFLIPRLYLQSMAAGLRYVHERGGRGFYAEAYANWGLDGPKLWVTEKLLWNPHQDVDELLDLWHNALFQEAASQMRAYFDFLESAWGQQKPSNQKRGGYRLLGPLNRRQQFTEIFAPAICDRAWELLEAAEARATQEVVKQRIAYFKQSFGATRLAAARLWAADELQRMRDQEREAEEQLPLSDWVAALDRWARFPSLNEHMDALREAAPESFQEFCMEVVVKNRRHSFAGWDSDAPVLRYILDRALKDATAGQPSTKAELDARISALFAECNSRAAAAGKSCDSALRLLNRLAATLTLEGKRLTGAPVLDGAIEPEVWGEPQFDGCFYQYPFESETVPERTRLWVGVHEDELYVAFDCIQAPGSVRKTVDQRDAVRLNQQGRIDLGRAIPYLAHTDSVGVQLPHPITVIVTAGGGLFDAQPTRFGFDIAWNGARAAVKTTERGWAAEIAVELPKAYAAKWTTGIVPGYNFFRIRDNTRSAWNAASPRKWSIHPRTRGTVCFP